jgi:hypothetical protein
MDLSETVWEGVDWMYLAQEAYNWWPLVNTVMNFGLHKRQGIC